MRICLGNGVNVAVGAGATVGVNVGFRVAVAVGATVGAIVGAGVNVGVATMTGSVRNPTMMFPSVLSGVAFRRLIVRG